MKNLSYACPACGSTATKRCAVLYEQSVNEGPDFNTQRSFGKRAAPPTIQSKTWSVLCFVIGSYSLFTVPIFGVATILLGIWLAARRSAQLPQFNKNLELYEKLWICTDCANVYKPAGSSAVMDNNLV